MVETHAFQVILSAQVGDVNDKKIKQIMNLGYMVENHVPGVFAQFVKAGATEPTIIIAQNQISLAIPRANSVEEFLSDEEKIISYFDSILETLLLDWDFAISVTLERSYTTAINTFEAASNKLKNPTELEFEGSLSIGYRIPFRRENMNGEFKIEPFFSDPNRFFLSIVIQKLNVNNREQATATLSSIRNIIFDEFEPKARAFFQ